MGVTRETAESNEAKLLDLIKQLKEERCKQKEACGDQWVENDRLFIQWNGKPMNPGTPYDWLRKLCERENLNFQALHGFRHFAATQAIYHHVSSKEVADMLGHADPTITLKCYTHAVEQSNERSLNVLAKAIEGK